MFSIEQTISISFYSVLHFLPRALSCVAAMSGHVHTQPHSFCIFLHPLWSLLRSQSPSSVDERRLQTWQIRWLRQHLQSSARAPETSWLEDLEWSWGEWSRPDISHLAPAKNIQHPKTGDSLANLLTPWPAIASHLHLCLWEFQWRAPPVRQLCRVGVPRQVLVETRFQISQMSTVGPKVVKHHLRHSFTHWSSESSLQQTIFYFCHPYRSRASTESERHQPTSANHVTAMPGIYPGLVGIAPSHQLWLLNSHKSLVTINLAFSVWKPFFGGFCCMCSYLQMSFKSLCWKTNEHPSWKFPSPVIFWGKSHQFRKENHIWKSHFKKKKQSISTKMIQIPQKILRKTAKTAFSSTTSSNCRALATAISPGSSSSCSFAFAAFSISWNPTGFVRDSHFYEANNGISWDFTVI